MHKAFKMTSNFTSKCGGLKSYVYTIHQLLSLEKNLKLGIHRQCPLYLGCV